MECPLCKIKYKESSRIILEDNYSLACIIKEPITESHLLIIPKRHVNSMENLSPKESKSILSMLEKISDKLKKIFKTKGCLTLMNHNELKSQEHIHFHVIATNTGLRHIISTYFKKPFKQELSEEELETLAINIKKHL